MCVCECWCARERERGTASHSTQSHRERASWCDLAFVLAVVAALACVALARVCVRVRALAVLLLTLITLRASSSKKRIAAWPRWTVPGEYEEKKCRVRQAPEALEAQQDHRRNLREVRERERFACDGYTLRKTHIIMTYSPLRFVEKALLLPARTCFSLFLSLMYTRSTSFTYLYNHIYLYLRRGRR